MAAVILDIEQGTEEWKQARCGVITMSHARDLLTNGKGVTRHNYLLDVVSERLSGSPVERFQSEDMFLGLELEPFALDAYAAETGANVGRSVGFAFLDERRRIGCSPDGIIHLGAEGHGVEIKCPRPRQHMRYLDKPWTENHHLAQMQGNIWIFDAQSWDFVSFCPEFETAPLLIYTVKRDQAYIDRLAESAERAVEEIDAIVERLREIEYENPEGVAAVCKRAKRHMEALLAENDEVQL